jgi:hypothetical protein
VPRSEGITGFLHEPVVTTAGESACIRSDQPFVLGFAPVIGVYPADVAYTSVVGYDDTFATLDRDLAASRAFILERVREGDSTHDIAAAIGQPAEMFRPLLCHGDALRVFTVGPRFRHDNVDVTFREALVVIENGARWLDDDLPHHRRWRTGR